MAGSRLARDGLLHCDRRINGSVLHVMQRPLYKYPLLLLETIKIIIKDSCH
jgi:hypothetical protein